MTTPLPRNGTADPGASRWLEVARRIAAVLLVGALLIVLWSTAGAPWWPPVAGLAAALLVGALGRLLPRGLRRPILAGVLVGAAALWPSLSGAALALAAGGVLVAALLVYGRNIATLGRGCHDGRRRLRTLLVVAVLLAGCGVTGLVIEHRRDEQRAAAQSDQASEVRRAQMLPVSPARAARLLLRAIGDGDSAVCTTLLDPRAADQLAAVVSTTGCVAAVRVLAGQVADSRRYEAPDYGATSTSLSADGQTAGADLCHMSWNGVAAVLTGSTASGPPPGPQLGRLGLTRILGQGFQITGFTPC